MLSNLEIYPPLYSNPEKTIGYLYYPSNMFTYNQCAVISTRYPLPTRVNIVSDCHT